MAQLTRPTPDAGRTDGTTRRVLHVDDDRLQTELVSRRLPQLDGAFEVETATSVAEAAARLQAETFDALVTDFDMGSADATDLLDAIETHQADLPTVLFTSRDPVALSTTDVLERVDDYLRKGSAGDCYGVLADLVRSAIERHQPRRPVGVAAD